MKFGKRKKIILYIAVILLIAILAGAYKNRGYVEQIPIGCAFKAKALCAAVFVSGRDPAVVEREDTGFNPLFRLFKAKIDTKQKAVFTSFLGSGVFEKKAIYVDKLGCVLLSGAKEETIRKWQPSLDSPKPVNPEKIPWPDGDLLPAQPPDKIIDRAKINTAVERIFTETDSARKTRTRALLIVHDGYIIAERYAPGITKDTPLLSWSIAKSFTNALVGTLVKQRKLSIEAPAAVPEWQKPDDPRRLITLDQLLRMSSGLDWVEVYAEKPVSDVNMMLLLQPDMAAFAASKKLAAKPDTVWRYSSGTTNIICRLIRDSVGNQNNYWNFPRQELFNKIGMRSAVWETDAEGTFIGSSYLYATARDYARFGLLYLNDGVWQGKRLLPEGWVSYSVRPTPAAPKGEYGAHFWLNSGSKSNPPERLYPLLPPDAFFARGYQGQIIAILPSSRLVVVRLGMTYHDQWGMEPFIKEILDALK